MLDRTLRSRRRLPPLAGQAFDEEALHPLHVTAVRVALFLAIHPFQDGDGRLSRVLTTLLLLRAGYDYGPYASLVSVIEENKASTWSAPDDRPMLEFSGRAAVVLTPSWVEEARSRDGVSTSRAHAASLNREALLSAP